ncbi:hypothetical protein Pcinc_012103 [Petrolisthes cinctipes]|uniref:Neurotransmitter-gated ion-channel ligand-binding domain-containing protein n=1 Tax=Petrolisthes cinctipes TaxID=88211 RepID=A0AAE1KVR3_PETCI|nr:hypothetical protein Pcinc_012103 [Petrolisthes cinctipes]
MTRGLGLLLLLLVGSAWSETALTRTTELILGKLRKAPESYDPKVRPAQRVDEATVVQIQTFFRDIEINDVTMEANLDITFRMIWNDYRLAFNAPRGVEYVTLLDSDLLWLPDAFFKNAQVSQRSSIYPETLMRIHPDGRVIYSTRLSLKQSCPMDLARFPHDVQDCNIMIASYGYTDDNIKFEINEKSGISTSQDIHASRFTLEEVMPGSCSSVTSTGSYSCVKVTLKIRRVFGSYLIDWYIPMMFLVVVAWFSFLVPGQMFLGRLLLTLMPLITLASFCNAYKGSLASVAYARALDVFSGFSLVIIFLTLVYVIVCQVKSQQAAGDEERSGSAEDGEVKPSPSSTTDIRGVRGLWHRVQQRGQYVSRVTIITIYVVFLFFYFVAYCGTG